MAGEDLQNNFLLSIMSLCLQQSKGSLTGGASFRYTRITDTLLQCCGSDLVSMRTRIELFTSMRIRIQIHADPNPDQACHKK